jgi:DNA polymerase-4
MLERLEAIAVELESRLQPKKRAGKTITLKIKYSDFRLQTRSKTLPYYISSSSMVLENAKELLYQESLENSVRLLGISLSNLNTETKQSEPYEDTIQVQLKFDF